MDDADPPIVGLFDAAGAQDECNLHLEWAPSFFNVGRRFSSGYVYNLPGPGGLLRPALHNWQTSGIVTVQDGTPRTRSTSPKTPRTRVLPTGQILFPAKC